MGTSSKDIVYYLQLNYKQQEWRKVTESQFLIFFQQSILLYENYIDFFRVRQIWEE